MQNNDNYNFLSNSGTWTHGNMEGLFKITYQNGTVCVNQKFVKGVGLVASDSGTCQHQDSVDDVEWPPLPHPSLATIGPLTCEL